MCRLEPFTITYCISTLIDLGIRIVIVSLVISTQKPSRYLKKIFYYLQLILALMSEVFCYVNWVVFLAVFSLLARNTRSDVYTAQEISTSSSSLGVIHSVSPFSVYHHLSTDLDKSAFYPLPNRNHPLVQTGHARCLMSLQQTLLTTGIWSQVAHMCHQCNE